MTACVFSGPTLSADEIRAVSEAQVLPPAAMGDVIAAVRRGFTRIGIIDGYFEGQPSVWHKEVLWAINQGATVFGAASIGALRAAELYQFGMIGVGEIFSAYAEGELEDDDEVALVHGPAELGYQPLSEPMVNIRLTLAKAVEDGVLAPQVGRTLTDDCKMLHFPNRTWANLLESASKHLPENGQHDRLSEWLADNKIDQKKRDALEMLRAMSQADAVSEPNCHMQWTVMWDKALQWRNDDHADHTGVLDELRLSPDQFANMRRRALARVLASDGMAGGTTSGGDMSAMLSKLRREQGLFSRAALESWMADNALTSDGLERLLATDGALEVAEEAAGTALDDALIDELKRAGQFAALSKRAEAKRKVLANDPAATPARPPGPAMLLDWFIRDTRSAFDPEQPDILAKALALPDVDALHHLVADEFLFRKLRKTGDTDDSTSAPKEF